MTNCQRRAAKNVSEVSVLIGHEFDYDTDMEGVKILRKRK